LTPCPALFGAQASPLPNPSPAATAAPLAALLTSTSQSLTPTAKPADLIAAARTAPAAANLSRTLLPQPAAPAAERLVATGAAADAEPADDWAGEPSSVYIPLNDGTSEYGIEYQLARRVSTTLESPVAQALSYLGAPYRMGGTTRDGIDCSGLIEVVFRQWGLAMPRTAAEQFQQGRLIAQQELQPGDLVFFRNTYKRGVSHVGIYVGDGRFIHAAGKRKGVVVGELAKSYYQHRFVGARRLGDPSAAPRIERAEDAPALVAAVNPNTTGR
jgi:cell wall-associated NlpC family hydrolase